MSKEPARIISLISAFATAAIAFAVAFGLDVSDAQRNAILGMIAPTVGVIVIAGEFIRSQVTPTEKALDKIDEAYIAQPGDPKPAL